MLFKTFGSVLFLTFAKFNFAQTTTVSVNTTTPACIPKPTPPPPPPQPPPGQRICYCENGVADGEISCGTCAFCNVHLSNECDTCDRNFYLHVDFCIPNGVQAKDFGKPEYVCNCKNGQADNGTAPLYKDGQQCGIDQANECQSCDQGYQLIGEYCLPICQCQNGVITRM